MLRLYVEPMTSIHSFCLIVVKKIFLLCKKAIYKRQYKVLIKYTGKSIII